ncbi:anhydro-N-acetylmuramic acid kinase [Spiribacter onubensis]|uniref:Anhydro-N-acetylmuramic acid kinase n=1 Tax=Spiribacter onubensis TaxID=3122420 RepID=A0ABV3SAU3_9GAMM
MRLIGLMSGTSLDGVDAALVDFDADGRPTLLGMHHAPYPDPLARRLRGLDGEAPLQAVLAMDAELAGIYAAAVDALLTETQTAASSIDGIALHGQTIWHAPQADPPVTSQIGDPSRLAEATGIAVVADFRQRDLAAGGEGAPLAPLFHSVMFAAEQPRCVVNIGGISNVTVLGPGGEIIRGFDTGPGNTLMDAWIHRHRGEAFDAAGRWAASGQVDGDLLAGLLADPYFRRTPPRSTGIEYFNLHWLERGLDKERPAADVQATLSALTACSIADAVQTWGNDPTDLIVTGGGALNDDLCRRLADELPDVILRRSDAMGFPAGAVEPVGFAWLGRATLRGEAVDTRTVTGASRPVILGGIYPA